jgi:pyruvyl transferase EpsO
MLHGGGNFGDIYRKHQMLRNQIATTFGDYKIIAFPQTVHFQDPERLEEAQKAFKQHSALTLVARGTPSFEYLKSNFPSNQVLLSTDCAFMIGYRKRRARPELQG